MSFVDNDPPKELDVGSLTSDESINIYSAGQNNKKYKYVVFLTLDEVRALIAHKEKFFFSIKTNSKKQYQAALKIQEKAQKYIEEDKAKLNDLTK